MNVSKSDIPRASELLANETYQPRFNANSLFSRGIMCSVYTVCTVLIITWYGWRKSRT